MSDNGVHSFDSGQTRKPRRGCSAAANTTPRDEFRFDPATLRPPGDCVTALVDRAISRSVEIFSHHEQREGERGGRKRENNLYSRGGSARDNVKLRYPD